MSVAMVLTGKALLFSIIIIIINIYSYVITYSIYSVNSSAAVLGDNCLVFKTTAGRLSLAAIGA